jgi:ABC-type bacteriocin/lantibiotic exporter with double-glycine peptidase domain
MDESIKVDNPPVYVRQTRDETCWAASMAMLVNFRDGSSFTDLDICRQVGLPEDGATVQQVQQAMDHLGLHLVAPSSLTPEGWVDLLRSHPVGVIVPGGGIWHRIVIAGVETDGTPESTSIHILDPARGDSWTPYAEAERNYEAGAPRSNNIFSY